MGIGSVGGKEAPKVEKERDPPRKLREVPSRDFIEAFEGLYKQKAKIKKRQSIKNFYAVLYIASVILTNNIHTKCELNHKF